MFRGNNYEKLYKASLDLLEASTLEESYEVVVRWSMRLASANYGSIFEFSAGVPHRVYTSDKKLKSISPRKKGWTYKTFVTRKPYLRFIKDIAVNHPELEKMGVTSDISIPLNYGQEKFGVLSIMATEKTFDKNDLKIMEFFGPLASFSIRQQHLQNKLKFAIEERDLFISLAAHEIRSPLATILNYTELLERSIARGSQPDLKDFQVIKTSVRKLSVMIGDFLSVRQIESGSITYTLAKSSLENIVNESIKKFYLHFPNHKIKLIKKTGKKLFVLADTNKIQQSIINILRNSGKYSSEKKPITITLGSNKNNNLIIIEDKGVGISKGDLEHLFEKFFRGSNTNSKGMGLGLFLAKKIVDAHNGTIKISSQKGKWTKVMLKLPKYESGKKKRIQFSTRIRELEASSQRNSGSN